MTIQEAKDQVYKKHFDKNGEMWMPTRFEYSKMDNEAAELYAASKAKEAYNQGVRDAAESAKIICVLPDGVEVNDSDDIVNIPEGELTNLKISVNKNSILTLLK